MSKLNDAIGKLATFAQYEISDTGEYWRLIAEISRYTNMMSEEFEKALKDEIFELMDDLKNYKLVEVKETIETVRVEVVYDEFD
jgi:hypothetical protein